MAAGDSAACPSQECLSFLWEDEMLGCLWRSSPQQARKVPHHFWTQSHLLMMKDKKSSLTHCPCVWFALGFMPFFLNDEATGAFENQGVDKRICCVLVFSGLCQCINFTLFCQQYLKKKFTSWPFFKCLVTCPEINYWSYLLSLFFFCSSLKYGGWREISDIGLLDWHKSNGVTVYDSAHSR